MQAESLKQSPQKLCDLTWPTLTAIIMWAITCEHENGSMAFMSFTYLAQRIETWAVETKEMKDIRRSNGRITSITQPPLRLAG